MKQDVFRLKGFSIVGIGLGNEPLDGDARVDVCAFHSSPSRISSSVRDEKGAVFAMRPNRARDDDVLLWRTGNMFFDQFADEPFEKGVFGFGANPGGFKRMVGYIADENPAHEVLSKDSPDPE